MIEFKVAASQDFTEKVCYESVPLLSLIIGFLSFYSFYSRNISDVWFLNGVNDIGGKFGADAVDTSDQSVTSIDDTGDILVTGVVDDNNKSIDNFVWLHFWSVSTTLL
jgi:hypothetical protein